MRIQNLCAYLILPIPTRFASIVVTSYMYAYYYSAIIISLKGRAELKFEL